MLRSIIYHFLFDLKVLSNKINDWDPAHGTFFYMPLSVVTFQWYYLDFVCVF